MFVTDKQRITDWCGQEDVDWMHEEKKRLAKLGKKAEIREEMRKEHGRDKLMFALIYSTGYYQCNDVGAMEWRNL